MKRRLVGLGVAVAAAAAGSGVALWRLRAHDSPEADSGALATLWSLTLERPDGSPMALASLSGRPLLINFWATWCKPCLRELPAIEHWYQDHRGQGWQVLALAVDQIQPVRDFLARQPLTLTVAMAGLDGTDLIHQFGNKAGGMPFTVMIDAQGRVRQRKMGETDYAELTAWARSI